MTSGTVRSGADALDAFEPRWRRLGYAVVREPSAAQLPSFLEGFRPDAIAVGPSPSLAIEILRPKESESNERVARLREHLRGRDDWKLEVVVLMSDGPTFLPASADAIRAAFVRVETLAEHDPQAAVVMAWAALEAVGRALEPTLATGSLTTSALIDLLVSNGHLDQASGGRLRNPGDLRNRIAHGQQDVVLRNEDLQLILKIGMDLAASAPA